MHRVFVFAGTLAFLLVLSGPAAAADLTEEQLTMLHDTGGWEYLDVFDKHNGFPTRHQCFAEGQPSQCTGQLKLLRDGTFTQYTNVDGGTYSRHGTYELNGDTITFQDELGTKDGPYQLEVNVDAKTMQFSRNDAGVLVGADLKLEREHRKQKREEDKQNPQ